MVSSDYQHSLRVDESLAILCVGVASGAVYVLHHVKVVRHIHLTNILLSGQPKLVDKEVKICETPGDWSVLLPGEMSHKVCPV